MSHSPLEELQLEQMSLYAELLVAFENAADITKRISDYLPFANFSIPEDIQKLYNAIYQLNVGNKALTSAFKLYAESHSIELVDPS